MDLEDEAQASVRYSNYRKPIREHADSQSKKRHQTQGLFERFHREKQIAVYNVSDMSETKAQLRQQITKLEEKLEQARIYTDESPFECPLCSEINPETQIPYHYCSLHLQLAKAEKDIAFFAGNS